MYSLTQLKQALFLIVLVVFGLLPRMQAAPQVVPAPDGCYPGFTTAEGCSVLFKTLPRALETQELAGVRSFQPVLPASTPASVLERWSSTPQTTIRQLV